MAEMNRVRAVEMVPDTEVPDWLKARRLEDRLSIEQTFDHVRGNYTRRGVAGDPEFRVSGDTIETERGSSAAYLISMLATSKGWMQVDITGSDDFVKRARSEFDSQIQIINELRAERESKQQPERASTETTSESNTIEPGRSVGREASANQEKAVNPSTVSVVIQQETDDVALAAARSRARGQFDAQMGAIEERHAERRQGQDARAGKADQVSGDRGSLEGERDDAREQLRIRRAAISGEVFNQYRVAGERFYFRDQAGSESVLAFKAPEGKLKTSLNSERVSTSMVALAESRGWDEIEVKGHREFKRQVWREATARGIDVRGYEPDRSDLEALSHRREIKQSNTIEKAAEAQVETAKRQPEKTPEQPMEPFKSQRERPVEPSSSRTSNASAPTREDSKPETELTGKLTAHGPAPYQNDPDKTRSYYATVDTDRGERTVWGVRLPEALKEGQVSIGDQVRLSRAGKTGVTVTERDKDGQATNVSAYRNDWTAERHEKAKAIESATSAVIDSRVSDEPTRERVKANIEARIDAHQGDLPGVRMYDKNAKQTEERHRARTTEQESELSR